MQFLIADRDTWKEPIKTVEGDVIKLVAVQKSRRTKRKGKTKYIYNRTGTQEIYYNRSRNGPCFMPIAATSADMKRYHDVFVRPPLTDAEKAWLDRYDYKLVS